MNKVPTLNTAKLEKTRHAYLTYQLEEYKRILQRCYRQIEADNQKSLTVTVFDIPLDDDRYPYDNLCRYINNKLADYKDKLSYQLIDNWKNPGAKQIVIYLGDERPTQEELIKRTGPKRGKNKPFVKQPKIPRAVHRMYK